MAILLVGLDLIQMTQSAQAPELFGTLRTGAMSVTLVLCYEVVLWLFLTLLS